MAGVNRRSSCQRAASASSSSRAPRPRRPGTPRRGRWSRSPTGRSTSTLSTSAWNWQRKSFAAAPPSTRSARSGTPRLARHGVEHVAALEGDRLERGARQVRARGAAREADERAARVRDPSRARPGRRRRARGRRRPCPAPTRPAPRVSAALRDDAEPVAQPLDRRARDEHAALERVASSRRRSATPPWSAGPRAEATRARARVEQQEAAGAVGVLGHARLDAALAEERGLLIAGDAGRSGMPRRAARRAAVSPNTPADGFTAGSSASGTPSSRQQLLVPARARGCRSRACARRSTDRSRAPRPPVSCQSSHESTVPKQSSPRSARWRAPGTSSSSQRILVPEKYGVEHEPGLAPDRGLGARRRLSRSQSGGGAPALPDDGAVRPGGPRRAPTAAWSRAGS